MALDATTPIGISAAQEGGKGALLCAHACMRPRNMRGEATTPKPRNRRPPPGPTEQRTHLVAHVLVAAQHHAHASRVLNARLGGKHILHILLAVT